ncbi:hypothetical protein AR443_01620 [Bacillus velezensis]|uniref:Uncharacterized protein n=1 Tax=Bacillus amyloliquefaciens (strain Y2) TaxID=1155777 RepID=I2C8F9_BACAY|nr:hypothetical protein MUS_3043 [Bacillus velezensis YAU B9601-Y2]AJE79496.1 hypothetical protein OY17_15715 [Bacillus sp. BH072]AUG36816.1 hypothetical protein CXP43_14115 [Bacillus velezensis]QDP89195.1 hypothetical protein FGF55_13370 [Bacillus amyloliquefaciens]KOC84279.1 hypothetical protein AKJ10_02910 [Bacillus velezensis]
MISSGSIFMDKASSFLYIFLKRSLYCGVNIKVIKRNGGAGMKKTEHDKSRGTKTVYLTVRGYRLKLTPGQMKLISDGRA